MHLTILGASPATQNPGGACSSYLVRHGETTLVLDMGSGAFANLHRHVAPDAVDAVVISHIHADHMLDLLPYRYWLDIVAGRAVPLPRPPLAPGPHHRPLCLTGVHDSAAAVFPRLV